MKSFLLLMVKVSLSCCCYLLGLQVTPAVMAQQQKTEQVTQQTSKNKTATKPSAIAQQNGQAVKPSSKTKAKVVKPVPTKNKTFIPSDHISEDLSVSFPIDI